MGEANRRCEKWKSCFHASECELAKPHFCNGAVFLCNKTVSHVKCFRVIFIEDEPDDYMKRLGIK